MLLEPRRITGASLYPPSAVIRSMGSGGILPGIFPLLRRHPPLAGLISERLQVGDGISGAAAARRVKESPAQGSPPLSAVHLIRKQLQHVGTPGGASLTTPPLCVLAFYSFCIGCWGDPAVLFVLPSCCRRTSGAAPLPAHPNPEAAGLPWGPPASAVHRLLPGPVGGAAVASRRARRDHAGGRRRLRGGDPSA